MVGTLNARLSRATPPLRSVLVGAPLWAVAMTASAWLSIRADAWANAGQETSLLIIFFAGALLAFPAALAAAGFLVPMRRRQAAFAAAFVALAAVTIGLTALLFGLDYRAYYSTWHGDAFTREWAVEFFFTVAAGIYQFLALGMRMYLPIGLPALFAAAFWWAASPR